MKSNPGRQRINEKLTMKTSRRKFLKKTSLGAGMAGAFGSISFISSASWTNLLKLKIAGYDVNRVKALAQGKVKIEGCDFTFTKAPIGDLNTNTFSGAQDYDVTEVGLHPFMLAYANDGFRDYSLLPIFPLRIFRHKSIFIRNDRGINKPEDLKGKTIGTPGYSSTSLTWIRGMLQDEYGISPKDINWVTSNKDSSADTAGKISKNEQVVPDGIKMELGPAGKDESDLLADGVVDALFHAAVPKCFVQGHPKVDRLFADSRKAERAYYSKTGIFPIMHAVAIRNSILKENPWVVEAIFDAYSNSKKMDYKYMLKLGWAYDSLPWYTQEMESTIELMGNNFWPYGIEANRKTLEALFKYSFDQGLANKKLTIGELFAHSSLNFKE